MKKLILFIIGMIFILGCGKEFKVNVKEGEKVPEFALKDLEGKKYKSGEVFNNGKKTLFIIAAEWCPHCREEMPDVQRFYDENKDKANVAIVFTNSRSSLDAVKKYINENGYKLPVYYDEDGEISKGFQIEDIPFNLIIENGKIVKEVEGKVTYDMIVSELL